MLAMSERSIHHRGDLGPGEWVEGSAVGSWARIIDCQVRLIILFVQLDRLLPVIGPSVRHLSIIVLSFLDVHGVHDFLLDSSGVNHF